MLVRLPRCVRREDAEGNRNKGAASERCPTERSAEGLDKREYRKSDQASHQYPRDPTPAVGGLTLVVSHSTVTVDHAALGYDANDLSSALELSLGIKRELLEFR